jgi:CxxC motif-containing protein
MAHIRDLTCIVCPKGCPMQVTMDGKEILKIEGFTCPRGKQYAIDECTHPMRTITSTARTENGEVVPVKTDRTVPKELMFDCMKEINKAVVKLPAKIGDVVVENILGTGANVVVTANMD